MDVKGECGKFGIVLHIAVEKDSPGHVYLKFSDVSQAQDAVDALNGRFFAEKIVRFFELINKITANFVSEAVYNLQFPAASKM